MKGKNYIPISLDNKEPSYGFDSTFKFPIKPKVHKKCKVNTRRFSPVINNKVRYMWETSIPYSWFNLASPSKFYNASLDKLKNRNTLKFLEETQKYIYEIRKPLIIRNVLDLAKSPKSTKKLADLKNINIKPPKTPRIMLSRVVSERKKIKTASVSGRDQKYSVYDFNPEISSRKNSIGHIKFP